MKKALLTIALVTLLVLCLAGCSGSARTLNVYNWGEYISDGSEGSFDTIREFEDWYEETYGEKVKVNYTTASGMNAYQYFEYTEAMEQVYGAGWTSKQFNLTLRGASGLENLTFTAELVSTAPNGTSVVWSSDPYSA